MPPCKKNKKALSAAEKQKRYRAKRRQDAQRESLYKEKHKIRNAKRKKVSEMTSREHRQVKRRWKISAAASRERKALKANFESPSQLKSTPVSAELDSTPVSAQLKSRQKGQGRKCILKNRSKTVRENTKMKEKIQELQKLLDEKSKKIEKYRKRYAREVTRKSAIVETPRSKTKKLLKNLGIRKVNMKHEAAKKLVFHDILVSNLKTTYRRLPNANDKRMIGRIMSSKLCQKYKMQSRAAHTIGLKYKKRTVVKTKEIKEQYEKIEHFFYVMM